MAEMNRRKFLLASTGVGAAGLLSGVAAVNWSDLTKAATERPLPDGSRILVLVTMYGGNDGLNTVIPYADPAYHDHRPDLAYAASDVLHLDDQLGLNPGMKGLAGLWQQRHLAIIRGVGYPKPDHSHFRSMDIWQTASPDEPVTTGWLGRWLDATGDDPLRVLNIGDVLPPLVVGEKDTAAALSTGAAKSRPSADTLAALGTSDPHDSEAMAMVRASYRAAYTADTSLARIGKPDSTSKKDHNQLATQLDAVGRCITAGLPTRVYTVSLSGFDTHADERGTQQRLLTTLDSAVSGFLSRMASDAHGRNVVLAAYSEFGRRVAANASEGTDHGTAAPVLIAGAPVKGGFYGDEPSLTDLDNGDLNATTDFRDVYQELLTKVIGTDPGPVLGSGRREIGFV